MSNQNRHWCRHVSRDEAVRAAEDAAAVPAIQHRDLPEQVALLWASLGDILGRVVRLEAEMDAVEDEAEEAAPAVCDPASPAEGLRTERVTLEIVYDAQFWHDPSTWAWSAVLKGRTKTVRVVDADAVADEARPTTLRERTPGEAAAYAQGMAATVVADLIRERDAARAECERLKAKIVALEGHSRMDIEREIAVEEAWERCGITPHWPDDEPGTSQRYAASMEAEIGRLRARVAELERERDAAKEECEDLRRKKNHNDRVLWTMVDRAEARLEAATAANAGGAKQEPVAWGVRFPDGKIVPSETREWAETKAKEASDRVKAAGVGASDAVKCVPLYAAPPESRGWMTAEEREAVDSAADAIGDRVDAYKGQDGDKRRIEVLDALLARETPPRVRRPPRACTPHRDSEWIAAIRAAGGEVAE